MAGSPQVLDGGQLAGGNGKTLLMVYGSLRIGGVARKIVDISRYLSAAKDLKDWSVYLVLEARPPEDPDAAHFYREVEHSGVTILYRPENSLLGIRLPFFLFLLWQVIAIRPTVVLAFFRRFALMAAVIKLLLWWRATRLVISDDTFPSLSLSADTKSPLLRSVIARLIRTFYPRADLVISPSEAARQDLIQSFAVSPRRLIVNRNWVLRISAMGAPGFAVSPQPNGTASRPAQYDLIYVGRFGPEKNLVYLLDLIAEVCRTMPDLCTCIVGGRGDIAGLVRATVERQLESNIAFVGVSRDVGQYYAASKVYCLTSLYEGLPIAPLEAMLHGLPVITTAYPGAGELVIEGKTGYVCRTKQEYVARVLDLLTDNDRRQRMGALAREHAQRCHGRTSLEHFVQAALGNWAD